MDSSDKIAQALRLARSTGGKLELDRAKEARRRAPGQIAPSKYMPGVPRQVRADGGRTGFLQKAHFNPSVDALKRLAKNSKYETARIAIDKDNNLYVNGNKVLTETKLVIDKSVNYAIIAAGVCAVLMLFIEVFKVFHPYI